MGKTVDFEALAERCPPNLTGADFYALCSDALLNSITDQIEKLEQNETKSNDFINRPGPVFVEQEHFLNALKNLVPSVSEQELKRYEQIRQQFQ